MRILSAPLSPKPGRKEMSVTFPAVTISSTAAPALLQDSRVRVLLVSQLCTKIAPSHSAVPWRLWSLPLPTPSKTLSFSLTCLGSMLYSCFPQNKKYKSCHLLKCFETFPPALSLPVQEKPQSLISSIKTRTLKNSSTFVRAQIK